MNFGLIIHRNGVVLSSIVLGRMETNAKLSGLSDLRFPVLLANDLVDRDT